MFVEEVEGAQTRLVAVYHTSFPKRLGPVRSARTTDVQLLPLFGKPGLVYSGANTPGPAQDRPCLDRADLPRSTRDHRRVAPHNVFVDLDQIARHERRSARRGPIGWTFATKTRHRRTPGDQRPCRQGRQRHVHDSTTRSRRYMVRWRGQTLCRRGQRQGDQGRQRGDHDGAQPCRRQPRRARLAVGAVRHRRQGQGRRSIATDARSPGPGAAPRRPAPLRFTDARRQDIALKPGKTWVLLKG